MATRPAVHIEDRRATVKRDVLNSRRLIVTMPDGDVYTVHSAREAAEHVKLWAEGHAVENAISVVLVDWDGVRPPKAEPR